MSAAERRTGTLLALPNRLMLGREICTPLTLLAPPAQRKVNVNQWVEQLHENLRDTYKLVVNMTKASHRAKAPRAARRQNRLAVRAKAIAEVPPQAGAK